MHIIIAISHIYITRDFLILSVSVFKRFDVSFLIYYCIPTATVCDKTIGTHMIADYSTSYRFYFFFGFATTACAIRAGFSKTFIYFRFPTKRQVN